MPHLTQDQHKLVSDAVREAETQTSGEIVTVLADRSDGYTDVALWWAVGLAMSVMTFFATFPALYRDTLSWLTGGWGTDFTDGQLLGTLVAAGLIAFLIALFAQMWDPLRFLLVPSPVKTTRCHEQAIRHFKVGAERRTHGRTGVLIYLSMQEHRAEIVADDSIAEIVEPEVWGEAMGDMLEEIRDGRIAEGMAAGVRDVGFVLAEHFPRSEEDVNELPDRLIEV